MANLIFQLRRMYHWILAFLAALIYRFPSRHIKVIAVTGTKGKSSTTELIGAILDEAGHQTAVSNTIRFKIGGVSEENLYKMSMPGRFFVQKFIRKAVKAGCDYIVIEMTSQGALLHRHQFVEIDSLVITNISPEHIEAHGSYEKYVNAKIEIAKRLEKSKKPNRAIIVNADDKEAARFLKTNVSNKISYSSHDVEPFTVKKEGLDLTLSGKTVHAKLSGLINLYNITAAIAAARNEKIPDEKIMVALEKFQGIRGRLEKVEAGQDFQVVVDYAHTPDSLTKFYQVFEGSRKICVLGGTGGGRDAWKRAEMGRIADSFCEEIILTDEDPYDEDPRKIVDDVAAGIVNHPPTVIMDRRGAIREALKRAKPGDAVLITGKGTDPYIMGAKGKKTPWSDSRIAREEIEALLNLKSIY